MSVLGVGALGVRVRVRLFDCRQRERLKEVEEEEMGTVDGHVAHFTRAQHMLTCCSHLIDVLVFHVCGFGCLIRYFQTGLDWTDLYDCVLISEQYKT